MQKFKKGDRVRLDASLSPSHGRYFLILEDDSREPLLLRVLDIHSGHITTWGEDNLELVGITWDTLMEGDVVVNNDGREQVVLGICGKVIFLSYSDVTDGFCYGKTVEELKKDGYTIKNTTEEEVQEMTVEEISKLVGKTVKVVEKK